MSIVSAAGKLSPDTSIPGRDQGHAVVVHVVRPNPLDPRPLSPKNHYPKLPDISKQLFYPKDAEKHGLVWT